MEDITVGQVSGIIAAGGYVAQFFIPTATALILAGLLSDENTLMTWTQAARAFQSSYWPFLVRADFTIVGPVARPVTIEALVRPLILILLAVAGVVTPLGLYDTVIPGSGTVETPFSYQEDHSAFGYGTAPRSDLGFNRKCGYFQPVVCPGSDTVVNATAENDEDLLPYGYDMSIPQSRTEMFQSGLEKMAPTVSSLFDIEHRSYVYDISDNINNGSKYVVGGYHHIETLVLKENRHIIEGLIVDMENGGIGFRRHTTPGHLPYGALWSEDLLFVEPQTECVNLNLTLDLTYPSTNTLDAENVVLTDRGGFAEINTTPPSYNRSAPEENPDLFGRAYEAAWLFNVYTMVYMNLTNFDTADLEAFSYFNATVGNTYPIKNPRSALPKLGTSGAMWGVSSDKAENFFALDGHNYTNPFNLTVDDFSWIRTSCQGAAGLDYANISNIGAACGIVLGSPRRDDGSNSVIFEPRSKWTVPMYSCASAAKASIKTVDFRYNGTDGLESLDVLKIRDKEYENDDDVPLWGVENTTISLADTKPLWGLVSDRYRGRNDLSVLKKESLWLPGWTSVGSPPSMVMNLPGIDFYNSAFQAAYTIAVESRQLADYTGQNNIAMFLKWQNLTAQANTTRHIINAVWTDIAANSVVGTRGWLQNPGSSNQQKRADVPEPGQMANVPVNVYQHRVAYQLVYGIPAFIVLAAILVIAVTAAFLSVFGRARPAIMRRHLFHTALGRVMAAFNYPGQAHPHTETRHWNALVGGKNVSMVNLVPQPTDVLMMPRHRNASANEMENPLLYKTHDQPTPPPAMYPSEGFSSSTAYRGPNQ